MSIASPARSRLLLCLLLVALSVPVLAVALAPPGSAAAAALRPGLGHHLPGGDFAGFYVTRAGRKVYCIDPGRRAPRTVSLTSIARYRGMSQRTADRLAYALTTWGDARTRAQAAVESQLVNTVVGNTRSVRRRAAALPRSVRTTVAAHLRIVRARSGPYSLQVRAARAASPGQTATGTVTVRSATRSGVPGVVVRLQGSGNVTLPRAVRTGSRGSVSLRYTVTGAGPVRIHAIGSGLAPPRFIGTHPAAGRQRMVTWGRSVDVSAATGFSGRLGGFAHAYSCTTTCSGRPSVSLRACAVPSSYASRIVYRAGGTSSSLDFPAGTRRRCRSVTLVLADRDRVTAAWTFHGPPGWTTPVPAAGAFVVDCPAVPAVAVSLRYDCRQGSIAATVSGGTAHAVALILGGAVTRRLEARPGGTATFRAPVRCATVQTYTVRAGVQRTDGAWNYGPAARIMTPGAARRP